MKRNVFAIALAVLLVAALVFVVAPETHAEETPHTHCLCVDLPQDKDAEHECADITFTEVGDAAALHAAMPAKGSGATVSVCLTADITTTAVISTYYGTTINLCLNGHNLTGGTDKQLFTGSGTVNITDCQYNPETHEGGIVSGKNRNTVYLYASGALNLYAGTVTSAGNWNTIVMNNTKSSYGATANGWSYFKMYGGRVLQSNDFTSARLFNMYGNQNQVMIYGGVIDVNGKSDPNALFLLKGNAEVYIYGGTIRGLVNGQVGFDSGDKPSRVYIRDSSGLLDGSNTYTSNGAGNLSVTSGSTVRLVNNTTGVTVTGPGNIDIAGGTHSLTVGTDKNGTVYTPNFIDSANTNKDGVTGAGKLTITNADYAPIVAFTGETRYFPLKNEDGTFSFHPFNLTISKTGINRISQTISIRATFVANDKVKALIDEYGVDNLTLNAKGRADENYPMAGNFVHAYYDLTDSLEAENMGKTNKYGAYIVINGQKIQSKQTVEITPEKVMEQIDSEYASYSAADQAKVHSLIAAKPHLAGVLPSVPALPAASGEEE